MITFANSLFQFLPQNHYILPPVRLSLQEKLYLFAIKKLLCTECKNEYNKSKIWQRQQEHLNQ